MQYIKQIILSQFLLFTFITCQSEDKQASEDYFIEWDKSTRVCIAHEGGYPRMRRLRDNSLIVIYENSQGDLMVKKSADEGAIWGEPVMAYEAFNYTDAQTGESTRVNIANPEFIQLNNGDILLASNLRPRDDGVFPFSIALKRSRDNGATWTEADILYRAATYFMDGCWEPSFLLLPNGTLHLYFANESPYRDSDEQEISMLHSTDNGASWSEEHTTVSFRKGKRDGMPVAVHNSGKIYVAIEDNLSKQFKPWLVQNPVEQAWANPVLEDSSRPSITPCCNAA